MNIDNWIGCYPSNWKGVIVPEAMAHPAKFSSRLIRRIYEHMFSEGWLTEGDAVVDPFGGVALGALDAMRLGLNWYGVELEPKFAGLGNVNIIEWNNKFGNMPRWGSAHLFNGDSRYLTGVIATMGGGHEPMPGETLRDIMAAISSPPFSDSLSTDLLPKAERVKRARELGISNAAKVSPIDMEKIGMRHQTDYGKTAGQLGAMKAQGFEAAISSPPFLQSEGGAHVPSKYREDPTFMARHAAGNKSSDAYGKTEGQLSSMRDGSFDAAISSPPFLTESDGSGLNVNKPPTFRGVLKDGSLSMGSSEGNLSSMPATSFDAAVSSPPYDEARVGTESGQEHCGHGDQYGESAGQLGGADDFWLAARQIVEQVYLSLAPGGHAVWVVKDYVKAKKIVPFCDQWRQLCEAVGFTTLHEHHASLIRNQRTQHTLDGGSMELKAESKSFFRRLAEKNGSPRIDYETVFCMVK